MAPKRTNAAPEPPPPPEIPQEVDPAVVAAREALDRRHAEERKAFERSELELRRHVEALETIALKCVALEKERRLNPEAWERRIQVNKASANAIYVKLLVGNRAVPQQVYTISPFSPEDMKIADLKRAIYLQASERGATRVLKEWFSPDNQCILLNGRELGEVSESTDHPPATPSDQTQHTPRLTKEVAAAPVAAPPPPPDPKTLSLKQLNVNAGVTLHLALHTPAPSPSMLPAKIL